jgi:hypothetical protein
VFATAFAQEETAAETAENTWKDVKNWFAEQTTTYLTDGQITVDFGSYTVKDHHSLKAKISLDSTLVGANFVTVGVDLSSANASDWEKGNAAMIYWQIERPISSAESFADAQRLLQDEEAPAEEEEVVVTGDGNYEGMSMLFKDQAMI